MPTLAEKINDKSVVVGIIGLGYVGLPLAKAFADTGIQTIGFDVDQKKMVAIEAGENYLKHLGEDYVQQMNQTGKFIATTDFSRLAEADAILVCVPTPLGHHLEPDLSYVEQTTNDIAKTLRPGQLIVLESTTYPGTTRDVMLPILENTGMKCGADFYLAYSPEREDPGRKSHNTQSIPKLVGGIDPTSGQLAKDLYDYAIEQVILVSKAEVAESAKLLENIYRAVNIALVNEMKILLTEMGVDIWEVVDAAATKPFGFQAFYPGPGLGGHCIPIDPFYLTWKAREVGLSTRFIELAGEVNRSMPDFVVQRTMLALNEHTKALKGAKVLILGLAYKKNVDDVRESPSLELIEKFNELGANVDYNDPHIPQTHKMRQYDLQMKSVDLSPDMLAGYDAVVVATDHDAYDWSMIGQNTSLIIDTRNALTGLDVKAQVVKA